MKKILFLLITLSMQTGFAQTLAVFAFWNTQTITIPTGFVTQNFAVSGIYSVPATGCTNMVVKVWGGGGGGGGGYLGHASANGGTGDYRTGIITVVGGETLNIYIGLKGMGGANAASGYPSAGGAGGTTTNGGNGGAGGVAVASGGGAGGGGAASSIVNGSATMLVLSGGGGGGAGGSVNSGTPPLNIGGSAPSGAGLNDSGTYASCVATYSSPPSCSAERVSATNANGTAGTDGQTGGGGGGGGGGTAATFGGAGGHGGTHYGSPYRSGGGDSGTSTGLSSSTDTTHGDKGIGDAHNAGTDGTDGYITLVSCS